MTDLGKDICGSYRVKLIVSGYSAADFVINQDVEAQPASHAPR
jgi:hypothetical protein